MHEVCARIRYAYQIRICSGMRMLRIRYVYQVCVCSAVSAQEMREGNQKKMKKKCVSWRHATPLPHNLEAEGLAHKWLDTPCTSSLRPHTLVA